MKQRIENNNVFFEKRLFLASLLFWIPVIVFILLAQNVRGNNPILFDQPLINLIAQSASDSLTTILSIITIGGDKFFVLAVTIILASYLLYKNKKRAFLGVIFAIGGAGVTNFFLKLFFERDRPDLISALVTETSFSFPSGHATGSAALGFTIIVLLWGTKYRWHAILLSSLFIFLVGYSRVYLGVHYPSDVVAGWCITGVWVFVVFKVLRNPSLIPVKSQKN